MLFHNLAIPTLFSLLFSVSMGVSQEVEKLGGFVLGSRLEEAEVNAKAHGWTISPLSVHLPGHWRIEGSNYTLFVCENKVLSVVEKINGDFEEFALFVMDMQSQWGEPVTQIISSGVGVFSTIDASFSTDDGTTLVQLQSVNGRRSLTAQHSSNVECTIRDRAIGSEDR